MATSTDLIEQYLRAHGPQASSAVGSHLSTLGYTESASRKAIERARDPIRKMAGIRLPNRQRILYLDDQYGKGDFWERIYDVLRSFGSIYGTALAGLQAVGGSAPVTHFSRLSGAPIHLKGQIPAERVLDILRQIGVLEIVRYDELGEIVQFQRATGFYVQPISRLRAQLVAELVLLQALRDWLRKNGWASWDKVEIREGGVLPIFGNHTWDLTAPCYLRPLTTRKSTKVMPGFVVADVLLSDAALPDQALSFLRKAVNVADRRGMRPSLAILVTAGIHHDALKDARKAGIMITTPRLLFGEEVGAALLELSEVLTNAAASAAGNPDRIVELFTKLSRVEGAAANLRGPLFEMIVGHCVREVEGTSIDIGVQAVTSTGPVDIDVLRVKSNQEVWAYECKGYSSSNRVTEQEVQRWITQSIPRIRDWLRSESRFSNSRLGFEFWTTSSFTPEALALLSHYQAATKKYTIKWRDGSQVEEYVQTAGNRRLLEVLREQYFRHPLSSV